MRSFGLSGRMAAHLYGDSRKVHAHQNHPRKCTTHSTQTHARTRTTQAHARARTTQAHARAQANAHRRTHTRAPHRRAHAHRRTHAHARTRTTQAHARARTNTHHTGFSHARMHSHDRMLRYCSHSSQGYNLLGWTSKTLKVLLFVFHGAQGAI